jgi:signal transduction histidine kinase
MSTSESISVANDPLMTKDYGETSIDTEHKSLNSPDHLSWYARLMQDAPIGKKLSGIVLTTSSVCLLTTVVLLAIFLGHLLRDQFSGRVENISQIIADNLSAPLLFNDTVSAAEVLNSLRSTPEVMSAVVTTTAGEVFISYGSELNETLPLMKDNAVGFADGDYRTNLVVKRDGTVLGFLYIRADFTNHILQMLSPYAAGVVLVIALSLLITYILIRILGSVIVRPISSLVETAREISTSHDFSIRAHCFGKDEVGTLTLAFNEMVARVEEDDRMLRSVNADLQTTMDERQKLQSKLLESSRLAGMAQVATGVLHNVGNVLNSVNISANLLSERLSEGTLFKALKQTRALLRSHEEDLPKFLSEDSKGRLVGPFLIKLGDQTEHFQGQLKEELGKLQNNIEHIKEVVAMQQSYSKAGGVSESVKASELIEAAIQVHDCSLTRHGISLRRDFAGDTYFTVERHHVIQALINFISNAIHAVKVSPSGLRQIVASIQSDAESITLSIKDSGVGISKENLSKIFQHGFTTRTDGHGFGLHTSANAIRHMGGELNAFSDGEGKGACFVIKLPLTPPTEKEDV